MKWIGTEKNTWNSALHKTHAQLKLMSIITKNCSFYPRILVALGRLWAESSISFAFSNALYKQVCSPHATCKSLCYSFLSVESYNWSVFPKTNVLWPRTDMMLFRLKDLDEKSWRPWLHAATNSMMRERKEGITQGRGSVCKILAQTWEEKELICH